METNTQQTLIPKNPPLNNNPTQKKWNKIKKIVTITMLMLTLLIFVIVSQWEMKQESCIFDYFHDLTQNYNSLLKNSEQYEMWVILTAQFIVDIALLGLFFLYITKFKNYYPFIWMLLFYVLRTLFIKYVRFPFPEGFYWRSQGVPSLAVGYDHSRDFFYSGHTGFMVYSVRLWSQTQYRFMFIFVFVGIFEVVWVLLITRVHYSIDIFSGWMYSEWFSVIIMQNLSKCDYCINKFLDCLVWMYQEILTKIERIRRSVFLFDEL